MNEKQIIRRAKKGELKAFEELMRLHLPAVRAYVAYRLPIENCVEEICQETFIFAYQNIGQFKEGSFKAWLKAIARNLVLKEVNRFKRQGRNLERYQSYVVDNYEEKEAQYSDGLALCLKSLKSEHRQLIDLRYRNNYNSREIAEYLGKGHSWVRTSLFRLRDQLRLCMEQHS